MLIVKPWHWLTEDGGIPEEPSPLRRNAIRVARLIEYGAQLQPKEHRETLVECTRRPGRKPCLGFMMVTKEADQTIVSFCNTCMEMDTAIYEWETTPWAEGLPQPFQVP